MAWQKSRRTEQSLSSGGSVRETECPRGECWNSTRVSYVVFLTIVLLSFPGHGAY